MLIDRLDWCWYGAKQLLEAQQEPSRRDDRWLIRAWRFLREYRADPKAAETAGMAGEHRYVYPAYRLYSTLQRHYIEAALLCQDASREEMAEFLGLDVPLLNHYAHLFFDVDAFPRNRLRMLLFPPNLLSTGYSEQTAWQLMGYYGGLSILKDGMNFGPSSERVRGFFRDAALTGLERMAALTNHCLAVDPDAARTITSQALRSITVEADARLKAPPDSENGTQTIIQGLLSGIKFCMPPSTDTEFDGREPRLYERLEAYIGANPESGLTRLGGQA